MELHELLVRWGPAGWWKFQFEGVFLFFLLRFPQEMAVYRKKKESGRMGCDLSEVLLYIILIITSD